MERETHSAQGAAKVGASDRGQATTLDTARAQRPLRYRLDGFHAGLLDTRFMTADDPALDATMGG